MTPVTMSGLNTMKAILVAWCLVTGRASASGEASLPLAQCLGGSPWEVSGGELR